jgi:hypothetical protein
MLVGCYLFYATESLWLAQTGRFVIDLDHLRLYRVLKICLFFGYRNSTTHLWLACACWLGMLGH